jgi:hypothetical protein
MKIAVCLRELLFQSVIFVMLVVILCTFGFPGPFGFLIFFIGMFFLAMNMMSGWILGQYSMIPLIFARKTARKYFRLIFEINPPRKEDWLAMKVCQRVVSAKLSSLTKERDALYKQEDEQIQSYFSPDEAEIIIFSGRSLHARIEKAKTKYEEAKWLARLFSFSIY